MKRLLLALCCFSLCSISVASLIDPDPKPVTTETNWQECWNQYPIMYRMWVPDGWLMRIGYSDSPVYVPDAKHSWSCAKIT